MSKELTDSWLVLKTTAPKTSKHLLRRDRISLDAVNQYEHAITLVTAPDGYGKTSLLLQWRREALQAGGIVAWLTLDKYDNASRFVQGLQGALSVADTHSEFVSSVPALARGGLEDVTDWLARVAGMAVEVQLILDGAENLPKETETELLPYLFLNCPPNLKIVVASSRKLSIDYIGSMPGGSFIELQTNDICFTLEETIAFFNARLKESAETEFCVRMHESTKGWPLGLNLILACMLKKLSKSLRQPTLDSCNTELHRYFMELLISRFTTDEIEFLTQISALELIHPELCEYITENPRAKLVLECLQDKAPIFEREKNHPWLQIHPMAKQFLKERFDRLPNGVQQRLHARSADWLSSHEMYESAVYHARCGGNEELAYDLVEKCIHTLVAQGKASSVQEWMEYLPQQQIKKRISLRLAVGWAFSQGEHCDKAAEMVETIIEESDADESSRCEAAEVCATAALFMDDLDAVARFMSYREGRDADQPALQKAIAVNIVAMLNLFKGEPEKTNYMLKKSVESASDDTAYVQWWTSWILGLSYLWQSKVALAESVLRPAMDLAENRSGRRGPVTSMLAATLAAVMWELELFEEAKVLLADRLDVLELYAPPDAIIHGFTTASRLAYAEGKANKAQDIIENLRAIGEARNLTRISIASLVEEVRVFSIAGQESACCARLAQLETLLNDKAKCGTVLEPLILCQLAMARSYTFIVKNRWDSALTEIEKTIQLSRQINRSYENIQAKLLKVLVTSQLGGDVTTLRNEISGTIEMYGLKRIRIDTHPAIYELGIGSKEGKIPVTQAAHKLSESETSQSQENKELRSQKISTSLLTPKEAEILQFLTERFTNKQIAVALDISEGTVKWHVKNMFSKLKAGSRHHLVARARILGILD